MPRAGEVFFQFRFRPRQELRFRRFVLEERLGERLLFRSVWDGPRLRLISRSVEIFDARQGAAALLQDEDSDWGRHEQDAHSFGSFVSGGCNSNDRQYFRSVS